MLDTSGNVKASCWMFSKADICFVALGKYGDLALMLPAFKAVADEIGKPPIVMVSCDFAPILEGVSYVRPWVVPLHWWKGVGPARKLAEQAGLNPICVKFWDEPGAKPPTQLGPGRKITLKIHGQHRTINASDWDSYQSSQWRYAGFTVEQMMRWPLIFDKRNLQRESLLRAKVFKTNKPKFLVNCNPGGTSPFRLGNLVLAMVQDLGMEVIDLSRFHANYIYDLIGLYDFSAGMITTDTATLHLATASDIPYIALINNGGAGSVPRGNCVLTVRYADFNKQRKQIVEAVKKIRDEAK